MSANTCASCRVTTTRKAPASPRMARARVTSSTSGSAISLRDADSACRPMSVKRSGGGKVPTPPTYSCRARNLRDRQHKSYHNESMVRVWLTALLVSATLHAEPSALEQAEDLFYKLAVQTNSEVRFRLADQAQALCEQAAAERPKDPRALICISHALTTSDPLHPESCRPGACERAIRELLRARAIDAQGVEAERIASELGIVYSRV